VSDAVDVQEIVLENGFRLLLVEDHRVPRVAASLWYRVGGIQEAQGEHGSTHFLEHAIHQGTTTVGTKDFDAERPILREIHETEQKLLGVRNRDRNRLRERDVFYDELDWPTTPEMDELRKRLYELEDQQAQYREFWAEYNWYRYYGGVARHSDPVPATTGSELMEIDMDLPKESIELVFRLEADRMVNAVLRGWEAQRFTVLEQMLYLRSRFDEAMDGVTGIAHPVFTGGHHFRDFGDFNRASMLRIYDDYFVPNNATLALVGDITSGEARALAERYFGQLPRGPEPPHRMDVEAEPPPAGAVRLDWLEPLDPRVIVRYRIPGVGHSDRPVLDAIAALLRGPEGMLRDKLRSLENVDFQVSSPYMGSSSTMDLIARADRDEDLPAIEEAILELVEELRQSRVEPQALRRAGKTLRLGWNQVRSDRDTLAHWLGHFEVMDSWKTLQPFMAARESASIEDIQRVAQRYFVRANQVIVTSRQNPPDPRAVSHRTVSSDGLAR
jgi:predicted Zn-dependent peptidase